MKKKVVLWAVASVLLAASSCRPGSSPLGPDAGEFVTPSGLKLAVSVSGQGTGGLSFRIELKNEGSDTLSVRFSDSQVFDIALSNSLGGLVWKWSHDKAFAQLVWQLDLKPGESHPEQGDWDLKANDGSQVPPGTYRVKVWITSSSPDTNPSVEFSIKI